MSVTRETLMKMNKDVLAGMVLDDKERFDSTLSAITDDLAISGNVNDKLMKQLILVERK